MSVGKLYANKILPSVPWADSRHRKNELLNVIAAFPECIPQPIAEGPDLKKTMLEINADFRPAVKVLTSLADKVTVSPPTSVPIARRTSRDIAQPTYNHEATSHQ